MNLHNRMNWRRWIIGSSLLIYIAIMLVSCGKSEMEQIEEQLKLGQKYLEEQNYEEAVVAFQKVIELEDKEISAYTGLIQTYDGLKDRSQTKNLIEKGFEILTDIEASDKKDEFITTSIDILMKYQDDSEYMDYLEKLMDQYPEIFEDEALRQHMAEQAGILVMEELPDELKEYESLYQSGRLEELVQNIRNNEIVKEIRNQEPGKITYYGEANFLPDGFGIAIYGSEVKKYAVMYIGNWENGRRDGEGCNIFLDRIGSDGYYIGQWENDIPNGKAKIHFIEEDGSSEERIGTAENGYAEGICQELNMRNTNITGYEFNCKKGVPQSQGFGWVNRDELEEEIMALLIDENGEKIPVWHTWAGLRCSECKDDGGLDFLNSFDHGWAGWGEQKRIISFITD